MWGFLRHAADLILRPQVLTCSTSTCNNEINTVATSLWPSSILKTLKMTLISLCDIYQVFYKRFIFYVSASILTNAKTCIPGTPARHPRWRPPAVTYFMHTSCQSVSLGSISFFEKIRKNIAQGGPLPKRDIVDTKTHASCAIGPNMSKQTGFPTTWGKAERAKVKGLVKHEIQVIVSSLWPQWTGGSVEQLSVNRLSRIWKASKRSLKKFLWTLSIVWNVVIRLEYAGISRKGSVNRDCIKLVLVWGTWSCSLE